ncbi:MAG TPA: hypothetical protein VIV12_14825, partial [Streptosporangiaceae bacterium]
DGPQSKKPGGREVKPGGARAQRGDGQVAPENGSGVLRRLGRGKGQAEQPAEAPAVKFVRQQRVRQSRSKRSGKR